MAHTTRALVGLLWGLLLAFSVAAVGQTEATRDRGDTLPGMKVARASYQKALKFFNQREYAKAQKELEVCLQKMPDSTEAHFLLAKALYALKAYPEALAEIEAAKATHAGSVARLEAAQEDRRSDLRRRRRVQDQVLSDLRQELGRTTDPNARKFIEAQIAAAETVRFDIEAELNNFPAISGGIPARYFFFHGNIFLRLERLDEAVPQYREALKLQPVYPEASNNLASLYYGAKRPDLALAVIEQAEAHGVTLNPELKQAVLEALMP